MTEAATVEAPTTVTLSEICAELGIKPQGARVKLRRKMKEAKGEGFRWTFPIEQKAEIVALLTAKAEAKSKSKAKAESDDDGDDEDDDE
mgnify:CR=1 FL=1